jgi:hypothetical protein
MSSVFGHRPGAIYEDRAYSFRQRVPSVKILAAFVVGIGCAVLATKLPAMWSETPASWPAATSAAKPTATAKPAEPKAASTSSAPAATRAAAPATTPAAAPPESAPAPVFKRDTKTRHVRVIAPDRVPPPANAAGEERAAESGRGEIAAADTNIGAAPRDTFAATPQPESVPMPPSRPLTSQNGLAEADAPASAAAGAPSVPALPIVETPTKPRHAAAADEAREAAQKARAAREAKRAKLAKLAAEKRARKARSQTLQAQNEADGFSLNRSYALPDGRRVTVYRRYDESGGALAYGGDYSGRRFAPPAGSGLFSFFGNY